MQNGKVVGHQVFVSNKKPEYVIFASLNKYTEQIETAKTNLAEREKKRLKEC